MMKKLIIIALIAVLAFGCKTTKSVIKEHLKTDLTTHVDSNATLNVTQHAVIDSNVVDHSILTDNSTEVITQINYALPDSTGKQAVLSKIVTERTRGVSSQKDVNTTVNTTNNTDNKQHVRITIDSNKKTDSTVKTTTKTGWSIPWWIYLIIASGICFLGFRFDLFSKIYSLIKRLLKI